MQRIFIWLFSQTAIGEYLNGKKTYIGAGLIVLSCLLQLVEKLAVLFPEVSWLSVTLVEGKTFIDALTTTLESVGLGALALGVTHDKVKAKSDEVKGEG